MSQEVLEFGVLIVALLVFLWVDLHFFARGRDPSFREGVVWSIGWLVLSLLAGVVLLFVEGATQATEYTTVYLIERSLSLDNLFVFLLLFGYFGVPVELRARLLFFGIVAALVLRGLAILGGLALLEQFEFVIYVLGVLLILLAYRILKGVAENVDPDKNFAVRAVRRLFPVTSEYHGHRWFVERSGKRHATPLFVCLAAIVAADIAFAIDSIPAAFAITQDEFIIWAGNVFALLGLRALFVLVEGLIRRFRYLNQTIAIVLAIVGIQLILQEADLLKLSEGAKLGIVAVAFAVGIAASLLADRRDPRAAEHAEERLAEHGRLPGEPADDPVDDRVGPAPRG
jgi:tellurite resistance protein TerC